MALTRGDWMAAILVDSNVLLDVITEVTEWRSWSENAIESAAERFRLVINPVIYAMRVDIGPIFQNCR